MPNSVTVDWVSYDTKKAKALLEKNTHNRTIRNHLVRAFARDMAAGNWLPTGEAVKISNTGVLLDGQHRLEAVVRAFEELELKNPVVILTIKGLPDHTQVVMDTGTTRSAGDALHLEGFTSATTIAATAKLIIRLENDSLFDHSPGAGRVTNSEILDWLEIHPEFPTFIEEYVWRARKTNIPASSALAAFWVLWKLDDKLMETFLERLISLEGLTAKSPILALHKYVTDLRTKRSRLTQEEWIGIVFHAWNRWRNGSELSYLRAPRGGFGTREKFPYPKGWETAVAT